MKRESKFGAHIGTSSLLLIFLTLSLVSFGALSLASSVSDLRLSNKLLAHTEEYYAANHEAERFVAETDAKLRSAYAASADADAFFARLGARSASTSVPMNDTQQLVVSLEYVYPDARTGAATGKNAAPRLYRIIEWRIESSDDGDYVRHLPVSGSGEMTEEAK